MPGPALRSDGERFVSALAKAVHRFRAYPSDSPLCAEALDLCHRALLATADEHITVRIAPRALLVDDTPVAETPAVSDLRQRLHRLGIGSVAVGRDASTRDIGWFCREVVARDGLAADDAMPERLAGRGVQHVRVTMVVRPAVLGVEDVPAERLARVDADERQRRLDRGPRGGSQLYPPDRGWVRLDPGLPMPAQLSLTGLAQLVGDPLALSAMLVSLADQPPFDDPVDALADKFATVSALFRSLEPALASTLFERLARTVLDLPVDRREQLLQQAVLPALFEGRIDGSMLRHFPDVDLAETLALPRDQRTGGIEWTMVALDRIDLPPDRRAHVESMLAERTAQSAAAPSRSDGIAGTARLFDSFERGQITVDLSTPKEFRDFAAFDLAIDADAEATLAAARESIDATHPPLERLRCLVNLLSLEANPEAASRLLAAVGPLLSDVRQKGEKRLIADWIQRLRQLSARIRGERPEVAGLIDGLLAKQIDERLLENVLGLGRGDAAGSGPLQMLEAFGAAAAPALVDLLEHEAVRSRRHALVKMMSACAPTLAPGLLSYFPHPQKFVTRNLATVLGYAGPGYEAPLASVVSHPDLRVGREALRALAQIGSPQALDFVIQSLTARHDVAMVAEEVFWSFGDARRAALALLADTVFASRHPALARRLLERAARSAGADLAPVATPLMRYRFHVWRPALVRLGLTAARVSAR